MIFYSLGVTVNGMYSCLVDSSGNVYVSQYYSVFKLSYPTLSTAALIIGGISSGNTDGTSSSATFNNIYAMTFTNDQSMIYLTDYGNSAVRQLVLATFSTSWRVPITTPKGIVIDSSNIYLYVSTDGSVIKQIGISSKLAATYAGTVSPGKLYFLFSF